MATLALAAAGAAAGNALLPGGVTLLGATLSGAALGSQIGAFAGSYVDQALFGGSGQSRPVDGPRLSDLRVTASVEGAPIPRVYGRARLGGQVIWATEFEEEIVTREAGGAAKGGGLGGGAAESTEYRYYANFAVALAEGLISSVGRVWADGQELDLSVVAHRVYTGGEEQAPDSLIETREGAGNAPAFRGTAYIVFERLALAPFGNRLPQLSFEVYRTVEDFNKAIRGIVLIPGSGEFVYATEPVMQDLGGGQSYAENVHTRQDGTDWAVSLDQLAVTLPNVRSVSLVVSWFGTDLRAGACELRPAVETADKSTKPVTWSVAGLTRSSASVVSQRDGRPAYGGTPSDASVVAAIGDLKARGFAVTLTPFILMDVPEGNTLPNPYGGPSQPAYPWRGRITVHPAAEQPESPDMTAVAAEQIAAFVGSAKPAHFSLSGEQVVYSGPQEWSLRRMVLHQAHLAKAAGGVDAFVIGSELRGLSQVRDGAASYPFVAALAALAVDVKAVLGVQTRVLYAADWSEYFGHQPQDGSGDVYFHLDPLWASSSIDAIGIDCYWPLADWRDGTAHLDYEAGTRSIYDLGYLRSNVQGGEGYDWYYASAADRESQIRTPITDGAGRPWVFRYKDVRSWWLNAHYNRTGGVEAAVPTAWVPESKPFWLMEIGCPAVDRGANQPNVFVDTKSSENALPHFSSGRRDDLMQRRVLQAMIEAFDPASEGHADGANPESSVYAGRMVDLDHIHVYAWDARPFPAFPFDTEAWGDGENWRLGHWLNGRFASVPLDRAVRQILADYDFAEHDVSALYGTVPGYVIDRVMAPRDALQPLELAYFFDALETGGKIVFRHRGAQSAVAALEAGDLVEGRPGDALLTLTRGQETELPASAKIHYLSSGSDYRQAVAEARRLTGASGRVAQAELPIVLESDQAGQITDSWLFEAWAARERASFALPPSRLGLEPGDLVTVPSDGSTRLLRITEIGDHGVREIEARSVDPEVYGASITRDRPMRLAERIVAGQPLVEILDLPLLSGDEPPQAGYVAALLVPWPGSIAVYGSPETMGYQLRAVANAPAVIGSTLDLLPPGPDGRLDFATRIRVKVDGGTLQSVTLLQMFAGANVAAVRNLDGEWEVLQFQTATLVAPGTYELGGLLRGQAGTELAMRASLPGGAPFVLINGALARVNLTAAEVGLPYNWRVGPAGRDLGDASFVGQQHAFGAVGLRPLSPVHVRGSRQEGDLTITWIRRTRQGGDSWEGSEVPLAEEAERYEVDILDGGLVKRTISASAPWASYTQAQQIADFGAPQSACSIKVYQIGASYGRGSPRAALV